MITTLLWDIGGVVLSNGWDHQQRRAAAEQFGLDPAQLEAGHAAQLEAFETGHLSLDDYLARVVFKAPRLFTPAAFRQFLFSLSRPDDAMLQLLADLKAAGRARMATVNNESAELNQYRITTFGLSRYFQTFCSSCYTGVRKPEPGAWLRAMGILQASPGECLFIDDREENLATPRGLGINSVRFESEPQLRERLVRLRLL